MKMTLHLLIAAAGLVALPLAAAQAQTRKPAPKPAAAPARPASVPAPKPAPAPAAAPKAATAPTPKPPRTESAAAGGGPFEVGTNALNLGIGLGSRYGYAGGYLGGNYSSTPAISASFERGIIPLGPGVLGVGVFAGYQGSSYNYGSGYGKTSYTDIIVTVRGAFHYPVMPKLDAYGGLGLGLRRSSSSFDGSNNGFLLGDVSGSYTEFASGLFVGGRYYFTDNIGAFGELGYDQTYLKIGLSAKF